jgi:hypothetical protein
MSIVVSTQLHVINCACGGVYAITEGHREQCQRQGTIWHCPYCQTGWGFHQSEADRLRKELANAEQEKERLKKDAEYWQQKRKVAMAEAEHFRKSRDGMKGALASQRKRIAKGVCPCCNRHFSNLHRHMQTEHPDFSGANAEQTKAHQSQ